MNISKFKEPSEIGQWPRLAHTPGANHVTSMCDFRSRDMVISNLEWSWSGPWFAARSEPVSEKLYDFPCACFQLFEPLHHHHIGAESRIYGLRNGSRRLEQCIVWRGFCDVNLKFHYVVAIKWWFWKGDVTSNPSFYMSRMQLVDFCWNDNLIINGYHALWSSSTVNAT